VTLIITKFGCFAKRFRKKIPQERRRYAGINRVFFETAWIEFRHEVPDMTKEQFLTMATGLAEKFKKACGLPKDFQEF
jgi:hypothetical protein